MRHEHSLTGEQSSLPTRIATTVSGSLCAPKKLTAFMELEAAFCV
jgi:hypothetical protein